MCTRMGAEHVTASLLSPDILNKLDKLDKLTVSQNSSELHTDMSPDVLRKRQTQINSNLLRIAAQLCCRRV
jgi:hypothetical protein